MLFTRDHLERCEEVSLAPYGFHSRNSRGRAFTEEEALYRTCFQRDATASATNAFRRLEYKTQVFVYSEGATTARS